MRLKFITLGAVLLSLLLVLILSLFNVGLENNRVYHRNETIRLGRAVFNVEVVEKKNDLAIGLSGRRYLSSEQGMLFVMGKESRHSFWMKDMYFPIDIVWLDRNLKVVDITENVSPESYPKTFTPTIPAYYVIEVLSGSVEKWGIKKSDTAIIF